MTYREDSTSSHPRHPQSIPERFVDFHTKSPAVYAALVKLAREWVFYTRRNRIGLRTLFERARWELALSTSDPDFKLNNYYAPYYARLIMAREPDLAGLFEIRKSEADAFMDSPEGQELVAPSDDE